MRYLKTNTATVITVGPFLDKTDGITPETSITVTGCHLTLMVDNAGTPTLALDADATASSGNNDMVHITNDDAGFYSLELTAANVNYLGGAILSINNVGVHAPVFHEFMILPTKIYDSWIAGTDNQEVDVTLANGGAITTTGTVPAGGIRLIKNTAFTNFPFYMKDADGAPVTGLTVACTRSIDGGAFASCANSASEISAGWYKLNLADTDLNGNAVAFKMTGTGALATSFTVITQIA